jgi:hypothetical protein
MKKITRKPLASPMALVSFVTPALDCVSAMMSVIAKAARKPSRNLGKRVQISEAPARSPFCGLMKFV